MRLKRFLFEGDILRLMGLTFMTKPVGLVTQMLMAGYFGAGHQMDAYAFALFPIMFFSQTTQRVFSAVAIPQIIKMRQDQSPREVAAYRNAIIFFFYLPVILLLLGLFWQGDLFVDLVGRKLPQETKDYAYRILRFLALPGILACLMGLNSALLNLNKRFRLPASMPLLNGVVMLVSLVLLQGRIGIWALPVGFAISYAIQTPMLMFQAFRTGALDLTPPALPRGSLAVLWGLSWMVLITQALLMINSFVDKWFATGLEAGSIASINYSMTLVTFGVQFFSTSLVVVMFTKMSEYFAAGDLARGDSYVRSNLVKVVNLVVPAALGLFLISPELVRVLFQRGAFDEADALRTSGTLAMYMLGLPALVINGVVTKIFQSLQKLRPKIFLALQYILTNIIGNMILVKSLGTVGLAISSSAAINLHLLLSLVVLQFYRTGLGVGGYIGTITRAYVMAVLAWGTFRLTGLGSTIEGLFDMGLISEALLLGAAKFAAIGVLSGIQVLIWFRFFRK
jgi:putative peptidoglycan lipid II flippase